MHELKAFYQHRFSTAFAITLALHVIGVAALKSWGFFWSDAPMIAMRILPYEGLDLMSVRPEEPTPEPPGAPPAPPPPVEEPPPAPPPELSGRIIPVPDWMEADTLMTEMAPAPEQTIAVLAQAEMAGSGGQGTADAGPGAGMDGEGEGLGPGDRKPRLLKRVEPVYPRIARLTGVEGLVVLELYINTSGHVTEAKVIKSLGNTGCDEAAQTAAMQWRFAPALRQGRPIDARIRAPILFRLNE